MSYPSSPAKHSSSGLQELIPKKQQWALINQHKAIQFQRLKQLQKSQDIRKKQQFKQELDNQLSNKNDVSLIEKQADRRYYQYITKKAGQMKEKEQRQKYNKIMQRKHIQQQNQYYLDSMRNSRNRDNDPGYHLDIGLKSQMERKMLEQHHKKQMLDTLDKQLQIKAQQKRKQRINNIQMDEANLKYQYDQFDRRRLQGKRFGQNENVYQYYKNLQQGKRIRQKQLQHRLIDEAAQKKMQQQDRKRYLKEQEKTYLTNQMKNTLDMQVDIHQRKLEQQKKVNPEEITYSVIGNMFKQRQSPYNKHQYSQYLRRQAQQASMRKKKQQYMSQQQYRINMNQLNRAVSGTYNHAKYLDRSISSIGDNKRINLTQINDKVSDQDTEIVKMRLQNIKQRRIYGPNDSNIY